MLVVADVEGEAWLVFVGANGAEFCMKDFGRPSGLSK